MRGYAERIKPILDELDQILALSSPVRIDKHLVPLFIKYTSFQKIDRIPIKPEITSTKVIEGIHYTDQSKGIARIFYRACPEHDDTSYSKTCPECREARFRQTKELVHLLDDPADKIDAGKFDDELVEKIASGLYDANGATTSEWKCEWWAVELLIRYRHRLGFTGGDAYPENGKLSIARTSNNYTEFAIAYGAPDWCVEHAYSVNGMATMKELREEVELSVEMHDFFLDAGYEF
jgi:hypothetical protein